MNCTQCRKRLQDYLDETLEAAMRAELSAHIAACDPCRGELEALRKVAALVGSLDEMPAPAAFLQGVRERIDRPGVWERFRLLFTPPLRPGFSVAVPVLIVAFVAVYLVMLQPNKPQKQARMPKTEEAGEARERVAYELLEARPVLEARPSARTTGGRSLAFDKVGPTDRTSLALSKTGPQPDGDMKDDLNSTLAAGTPTFEVKPTVVAGEVGDKEANVEELSVRGSLRGTTTDQFFMEGVAGFERQAGDQTIGLNVLDLKTDQSNVEQIVSEEGGQSTTILDRGNLTGLLLEVPVDNYERAVERLQSYNYSNGRTFQTQQRQQEKPKVNKALKDRSKSADGPRETQQQLPLVVRRLKRAPAKREAAGQEAEDKPQ